MKTHKQKLSNGVKTKYLIGSIIISFAMFGTVVLVNNVSGQEGIVDEGIQYPIAELGNCADRADCKLYCDKPENMESCVNFAEKNDLMSKEEIRVAKNFIAAESKGPGGCTTKESCKTYCDDISRIDECVLFAQKNNLMPPEKLEKAKKIQAAIARGVKPPSCGNKEQCDVYCEDPDHMEECISFAAEAGFIQGKELEDAQKMLAAVKKGVKPPPCKGKDACDEYCGAPENMEVCMTFAMEAGFMNEKEKADSQKMLQALKKGIKPPNCNGKEACDEYCGQEEHFEECIKFSEAAGFMSADDAVMARKTKGKGPGDCKGKEECEAFCNNPDNQEACFNFAKENGLISEEDLKGMEEGKQRMQESLQQAPSAVLDCLNTEMGDNMVEKLKSGESMPSREIGDKMKTCFEKMGPPPGPGGQGGPNNGSMMPPGQTGPGGCTNPEECKVYCESHPDECQGVQPGPGVINPGGQPMPRQAGPGGCKGPEECKAYCESHPDECQGVRPGPGVINPGGQEVPSGHVAPKWEEPEQILPNCQTPEECQKFAPNTQPQGQHNYPMPGQPQQPPCEGDNCQLKPLPNQPMQQQPFIGQPPDGQQPMPPLPESPPSPSGFNPTSLAGSILKVFFPFLNF